jgi:hypothetical protein
MAALRNAAIHLLKDVDTLSMSTRAASHRLQVHPEEAIDLLNGSQCETGYSPAQLLGGRSRLRRLFLRRGLTNRCRQLTAVRSVI